MEESPLKSAIVTGATGFVGSWLVEKLLSENISVTALVVEGEERIAEHIRNSLKIIHYEPENIFRVSDLITGADVFYNIGWAGVSPENKNNVELQLSNICSALDAVKFAVRMECKRFIGIGTVAEYVYCDGLIGPSQAPSPADIYGAAKLSARFLSEQTAKLLGIGFNWVILPSTFGARRNDNNIITYTIRSLLKGECPSFTKLDQMWDFLYISDVARALYLIADKGIAGKTYGVGSGIYRPLHEYIETIRDMIDPRLPLGIGDRAYPQGRKSSSCVNISDLVADTGFTPMMSFEEGIRDTIRYFEEESQ
jgi:nucleoside-diphosphate-sugar epimerase